MLKSEFSIRFKNTIDSPMIRVFNTDFGNICEFVSFNSLPLPEKKQEHGEQSLYTQSF